MGLFFDRDGKPIDLRTLAMLNAKPGYRHVAQSVVTYDDGIPIEITTLWLGIDYRTDDDGLPLIFESIIVADGNQALDGIGVQYSTLAAAIAGHDQIHATVRDGRIPVPSAIVGQVIR